MRIVTWNVNSIRARQERFFRWLAQDGADVVCLQETKVADDAFPWPEVEAAGYRAVAHGQRTYNGVAILARAPLEEVWRGFPDGAEADPEARLIGATVSGVRIVSAYVPNGREVGSDKYAYKRAWLDRLLAWLEGAAVSDTPFLLAGDFNIAPETRDVSRPEEWEGSVLFNEEMRAYFQRFLSVGLVDAFRLRRAEEGLYSWWDYRMLGFPKNNGLRIDHILVSPPLAARCRHAEILREERKGKKPSDHAPVALDLV